MKQENSIKMRDNELAKIDEANNQLFLNEKFTRRKVNELWNRFESINNNLNAKIKLQTFEIYTNKYECPTIGPFIKGDTFIGLNYFATGIVQGKKKYLRHMAVTNRKGIFDSDKDVHIYQFENSFKIYYSGNKDELIARIPDADSDGDFTNTLFYHIRDDRDIQILLLNAISGQPLSKGLMPVKEKKGCFIATAVYGTPYATEIITLKAFRDDFLNKYFLGRLFIKTYYFVSPPIANFIYNRRILCDITRRLIVNPVFKLASLKKFKR